MSDKLDAILARANLPMTTEEVERLRRSWPVIESWLAELHLPEAQSAEPAMVFPAARIPA